MTLKEKLNTTKVKDLVRDFRIHVDSKDTISSAIGKMKTFGLQSIPVFKKNNYLGMLSVENIVSWDINPNKTKCETLTNFPPLIDPETNLAETCDKMWRNNIVTAAVGKKDDIIGLINFWEIIDWCLKSDEFKKIKIKDLNLKKPVKAKRSEHIYKLRSRMMEKGFDYFLTNDNVKKVINTKNMTKNLLYRTKEKMGSGDRKGEKEKRLGIESRSISKKVKIKLEPDDSVHKFFKKLKKFNSTLGFVDNKIITYKEILKYLSDFKKKEKQKVIFINETKLDEMTLKHMKSDLGSFLSIYNKKIGKKTIKELRITINDLSSKGNKKNLEISMKMITDFGVFYAKKTGWDQIKVFDGLVDAIEKQILKKVET